MSLDDRGRLARLETECVSEDSYTQSTWKATCAQAQASRSLPTSNAYPMTSLLRAVGRSKHTAKP